MHPHLRRSALSASLFFILATAHAQPVQPFRLAPIFQGKSVPEPPHQRDPWTPPATKLPEKYVSSIQALVKYGFANPRGCDYREVVVDCQSLLMNAHAWVIPTSNAAEAQRFAVTWSGLVYPVSTVGEAADLKADIAALIKQPAPQYRSSAPMESDLVWHVNLHELNICALLLLGETDAAEQLWTKLQTGSPDPMADPYLRFVHEYAWANYIRAVSAHERGDDIVSLLSAEATARIRDNVEKDAAARGLKRESQRQSEPKLYLDFLANIDSLVADEQRRVKAEKVERILKLGLDKFLDQNQRIAALIRDLDEVSARQMSQPGSVNAADDSIVRALIKEGEAAVDPLLQCFETDTRLTRSVGFHRSFFPYRYFIGVDEAAYRAISEILKVRTFGPLTEHGYSSSRNAELRKPVAEEIRAYWNKVRGVAEADRWYQTLADDKATKEQWLEVIRKIVGSIPRQPGAIVPPPIVSALAPPRPLAGEGLRNKQNPTITDLFRRRADEVAARDPNTSHRVFVQRDACDITLALAKWEPRAAIPEIHKRIGQCKTLFANEFHSTHARELLSAWFSRLCAAGIDAGDEPAADEYATWLKNLSPARLEHFESTGVFYALCRFPDHPKFVEPARFLFLGDSPYRPLHTKIQEPMFRELVASPLIGVDAFREMIKEELRNVTRANAKMTINAKEGSYSIAFGGSGGLGGVIADATDLARLEAKEQTLRVCDIYAQTLNRFEGAPTFAAYWPEDRRDAAIAALIAFVDRWGDCFRVLPNLSFDRFRDPFYPPRFHLPKLDHTATPDDVKQARAIFSLQDGKSEVRLAELPMFPQMARWKTLDKFPIRYRGQKDGPTEYDRAGYIWQAEEVLIDGKWQRYYGFVGNHTIAKVTAAEIEFLQKYCDDRNLRW
jgi:hypothetical protein